MPQLSDLMNVAQAARALGLSRRTILRRIDSGDITAHKLGDGETSAYVITRDEVERLASEGAA